MEPAIDIAHLDQATFGDRALRSEVLGLFEAQAVTLMQTIQASSGKAQREAAHALKGAARGIGAFAVADEAEKVEHGDSSAVAPLATRIDEARTAAQALISAG